ncbi:MAG: hypothetical protein U0166_17755 [Acidobacteriota bacterium]
MNPRTILILSAMLIAGAGPARPCDEGDEPPVRATMLSIGTFDPRTVTVEPGERWMGMFASGDGYELRPVVLDISSDRSWGMDLGDLAEGTRVAVSGDAVPELIFDVPALHEGPITTVFVGQMSLPRRGALTLPLDDARLTIVSDEAPASGDESEAGCNLVLSTRSGRQVLESYAGCAMRVIAEPMAMAGSLPLVLWAGDMDDDGKIDLLLAGSDEDGHDVMRLYLSSHAGDGGLVGVAAQMPVDLSWGC